MNYDWQQEVRSGESEVLWPSEWSCIYVRSRVAGSSAWCGTCLNLCALAEQSLRTLMKVSSACAKLKLRV